MLLFLLLLPILLSPLSPTAADNHSPAIFLSVCGQNQAKNTEAFDANFVEAMENIHQKIIVDAMENIHQNITVAGFATSASGSIPTVFGLGQCFSYLSPVNCQLCYSKSRVKLPHCLPATTGRIYLDGCFLEYADRNVSTLSVDSADAYACSNTTVGGSLQSRFATLTAELVGNLTAGAYHKPYYQVGSVTVSPDLTTYGMAQCWKSLNASGCRDCLEKGRQSIVGRCLPSDEAKAMNAGCFVRYSTEPFYLTAAEGGESGGSSNDHRKAIIAVSTVLGALVVVGLVLLWRMRRSASAYGRGTRNLIRRGISFKGEIITTGVLSKSRVDIWIT